MGRVLSAARKQKRSSVVSEDEVFRISIVPIETNTHIIFSICYLSSYSNSFVNSLLSQSHIDGNKISKDTLKTVDIITNDLYEFIGQKALYFPKHKLQEKCREIIVGFDADYLQPGREFWEKFRKDSKR